jgi:predicted site-specific integrase-resolvase
MSAKAAIRDDWMTAKAASTLLGISNVTLPIVAKAGRVRRKLLPGMKPKYSRTDVERIARECVEKVSPRSRDARREAVSP